ncbi:glycosyltransferase [Polynucleobacter sp. JS-JIR-II-b4]|uniref:MraY family glycosyltransferase n=1 Tax=Polynucleobacter sp. JS-JIR-II-b4 TaxID=1758390 RepID=UPI001BFEC5CE|nr:glycosyltransferase [Polynucleobacter sp. JS-JIR-II-b4]QWE02831.1 glycosyltransferase family 4 protein [Polynucleobacter sp. JS-JIR-II-b4]
MAALFVAFVLSCLLTALIVRYRFIHESFSTDNNFDGPQKFHTVAVPRIGGVAIFSALLAGALVRLLSDWPSGILMLQMLICALPAFLSGLIEDATKRISPLTRLSACFGSGILAYWVLHTSITTISVAWIDPILSFPIVAASLSCLMIAGLTNSYNIIDGFNGLACMVAMITLTAIGYVAFRNHDYALVFIAVTTIGSIMGFFIWNFPRGLIFLGDGGAYLIGFWIGALSILLIMRNPDVSPWFACLINIYPIFETLFSIWRKKVIKKMNPGLPDGTHLHMLIYGRIARWINPDQKNPFFSSNARTSPFLWVLSSLAVFPAALWWNNTWMLEAFSLLFCISYVYIYRSIVQFNTPRWLK